MSGICRCLPNDNVLCRVIAVVKERFKADAIVCQCGADCLVGDPISDGGAEGFNLSLKSITKCVQHLMSWDVPLLVLGGGGYHLANTARCWTYLTAVLVSMELPDEIPDHKVSKQIFEHALPCISLNLPDSCSAVMVLNQRDDFESVLHGSGRPRLTMYAANLLELRQQKLSSRRLVLLASSPDSHELGSVRFPYYTFNLPFCLSSVCPSALLSM